MYIHNIILVFLKNSSGVSIVAKELAMSQFMPTFFKDVCLIILINSLEFKSDDFQLQI